MSIGGQSVETVTSRKNPLIIHMKKLGSDRSYRYECGEFLCQGTKLFDEAKKHGAEIVSVLFCGDEPHIPKGTHCVRVPKELLESVSPMESAPDILFACKMPPPDEIIKQGRHIILEGIQDPGNVGTIIRTANAFMMESVILTGTSADPYNPKTVRATMGAVFRQRIMQLSLSELLLLLNEADIPLYATGLSENCQTLTELKKEKSIAIAIGNEGQGLSAQLFAAAEKSLKIPMNPACESLNAAAAAAVIMWELYR
jgi:TrmH family RNA methyltransferase